VIAAAGIRLQRPDRQTLRALSVELVNRHEPRKVEHFDLFELGRGAKLKRHHVHRDIDMGDYRRNAMACTPFVL
jgi:hypothetical protein